MESPALSYSQHKDLLSPRAAYLCRSALSKPDIRNKEPEPLTLADYRLEGLDDGSVGPDKTGDVYKSDGHISLPAIT